MPTRVASQVYLFSRSQPPIKFSYSVECAVDVLVAGSFLYKYLNFFVTFFTALQQNREQFVSSRFVPDN